MKIRSISAAAALAFLAAAPGCGSSADAPSRTMALENPSFEGPAEAVPAFRLARVEASKFRGIDYTLTKRVAKSSQGHPVEMFDVRFKGLKRGEFDFLKATYGWGSSRVKFSEGTEYGITDFLTPAMQASANKNWFNEFARGDRIVTSNCFSTAYEILRNRADAMSFYTAPQDQLLGNLESDKTVAKVPVGDRTRPMDVRLAGCEGPSCFNGPVDIFHAIVMIDTAIYFEMMGFGETPVRLVAEYGHVNPATAWAPAVVPDTEETRSRLGYYRSTGKPALPGPEALAEIDGSFMSVPGTKAPFLKFRISYDAMGRASLSSR